MRLFSAILSLTFLIFFTNCRLKHAKQHFETNGKKVENPIFHTVDTLNKYLNADSFINFPNRRIYTGTVEGIQVGFESIKDSITYFYELDNAYWAKEDSFEYGVIFISPEDLNGDRFKDIIATNNTTASGGNLENMVFLFDPVQHKFYHNNFFDLPNIHYDSLTHLIHSHWRGGPYSNLSKRTYSLSGDSLIFQDEIVYIQYEAYTTGIVQLEYYRKKNGKRTLVNRIKGKGERIFKIFTKTLWNSRDEF